MAPLRIAHLSDLHVGHENRGLDMCPHELKPSERVGRTEDYVATFESLAASDAFKADGPIDMLCITGDISNRAHATEFVYADRAIRRVASALGIPGEAVYFVPGNHDVHWPVMGLEPQRFWSAYRYAPLLQGELAFRQRASESAAGAFDVAPYFVAWESDKALIVGINSAAYDGPEDELHPGTVRQETLEALDQFLSARVRDPQKLRLCLLHHHPFQMSEPIPDTNDPTIVVNAENFLALLSKHCFDLVMHGHKHQPRLKTHLVNNCHPMISMCAGSFSAVLHPLHFDGSSNLFHVINVHGRDPSSGGITGTVQSWTHKGKWEPSHALRGIPAVEAFGSHSTPDQIRAHLIAGLQTCMDSAEFCRWPDLVEHESQLQHVRSDVAHGLLTEVARELGYDMAGDKNGSPASWAVFRRK